MTASGPRFIPWGLECLVPHVRAVAATLGTPVQDGPILDLGEGSRLRLAAAGITDGLAWEPADTPADPLGWRHLSPAPLGLVIAWPGPASLSPTQRAGWWAHVAASLAEGGLAAVRVDLLPGWHALTAVQDFARFLGSRRGLALGPALDEVFALARDTLNTEDGRWYGWLAWLDALRRGDPWAVPDLVRAPIHAAELHRWVAEAAAHGLSWVGDARGPHGAPWRMGRALEAWIREEVSVRDDPLRGEQIADYAHNQHARLLLFVRGPRPAHGAVSLPTSLHVGPAFDRPLWWAFEPPAMALEDAVAALPEAEAIAALTGLIDAAAPDFLPLPALLQGMRERLPRCTAEVSARAILIAWQLGQVSLRDTPFCGDADRPQADVAGLPAGLTLSVHGRCVPVPTSAPEPPDAHRSG